MYLKTLTLKGFKSFADTTVLELEPGVTVVVGPNGSGKSNVVDAVAWVLGAQGPSTVRSTKMEDVIFAGTAGRAALGRAEVHLTIDNSSGLLPIELSEVTLSRVLFRSGESEYAINGVPCRLLDVQELLSDSGVGRTQHVVVGQGQLDAVLSASPFDRRAVVEEAAGVLKYRRRKEKAERRLAATEGNLVRLSDLLREVRRSLRPLQRQAEAARRHGELATESLALRRHLAGLELTILRARIDAGAAGRARLAAEEEDTRRALAALDEGVARAEAELSSLRGEDLTDDLARVERLRERAKGLGGVLAERARSIQRDLALAVDATVVAAMEAEGARLRAELAEAAEAATSLIPEAEKVATAEAELASQRAAFEEQWSGGGRLMVPSRLAEVRTALDALGTAAERNGAEGQRLERRLADLGQRSDQLAAEAGRLSVEADRAAADVATVADELVTVGHERARADAEQVAADQRWRAAESACVSWSARAEALASALDEARARAGVASLGGMEGVIGALLDLVVIDDGWEAAVAAAAGEALAAVVVESPQVAHQALQALAGEGMAAVLPLALARPVGTPPQVGDRVRDHVTSHREDVAAALDALLGAAACVSDWQEAARVAADHPGAIVVTRAGGRFDGSGWRLGSGRGGVTAASVDRARHESESAGEGARAAETALHAAAARLEAARSQEASLTDRQRDGEARRRVATDGRQRAERDAAEVAAERQRLQVAAAEVGARARDDGQRAAELAALLPALEAEEAGAADQGVRLQVARSRLEERAAAVSTLRTDLEVRATSLEERRAYLGDRLAEVEARLAGKQAERAEAVARRDELERRADAIGRLLAVVTVRRAQAEDALIELRTRRQRQSDDVRACAGRLDDDRSRRTATERTLEDVRERARRAELEASEAALRLEAATDRVRRELDCEPEAAMTAECPPLPEGVTAPARARELERELRLIGAVNPLAVEEFDTLKERAGFLEAQLDDVRAGRRELAKVIRAVDEEIVRVFVAAYADVSENFTRLFDSLFPGGQGRLRLSDPDDPLGSGIDVEARPSGKNVRRLSLLSGGERSLTALAFLFAVFRSRPSPFYVLDEVEAALDDVNLQRFLDLVDEFRREAQLLVVSHQKRTMEVADTLYGVTMQPGGSSKVVSERVAALA